MLSHRISALAHNEIHGVPSQARFLQIAKRLFNCDAAFRTGGNRCCQPLCPRCQRIEAIRKRRRVEKNLNRNSHNNFQLFTATVAAENLAEGYQVLQSSLRKLRRRKTWRDAVWGGVVQADFKASDSGSLMRWNVHCHAILELSPGAKICTSWLGSSWRKYLADSGHVGSVDLRDVQTSRNKKFDPVSYYVTRRRRGDLLELDDTCLAEFVLFLPRKRIISVLGTWRSRESTPQPPIPHQWSSACEAVANSKKVTCQVVRGVPR
jgi:hypothetical protein